MGIFDKKKEISRREFKRYLIKSSPYVPGGGFLGWQERAKLVDKIDKIFGDYITESEFNRALRKIRMERYNAKTQKERIELDRAIRYLESIARHSPEKNISTEKVKPESKGMPNEKTPSRIGVLRDKFKRNI